MDLKSWSRNPPINKAHPFKSFYRKRTKRSRPFTSEYQSCTHVVDHYFGESHYKTLFFRIGANVTVINTTKSSVSTSANARFQNRLLRLQAGEQKKLEWPHGGSKKMEGHKSPSQEMKLPVE